MAEFVLNKTQRLTFDPSSPNGILLFREVSKVIVAYGNRALQLGPASDPYGQVRSASGPLHLDAALPHMAPHLRPVGACLPCAAAWAWPQAWITVWSDITLPPPKPSPHPIPLPPLTPAHAHTCSHPPPPLQKYKGIWVCLTILTRALGGNYVNFGVFELYGDPALKVGAVGWWVGARLGDWVVGGGVRDRASVCSVCVMVRMCLRAYVSAVQDALDMSLKLALSIPLSDILAYRQGRGLELGGGG
jgi:hypothetical protein